ncbi:MAG: hypothetical protein V3T02_07315 [Alphaproteobacteria bacterium]
MDRINAIALSGMQAAAVRASVAADNLVKAGAAAFASDAQRASGEFAPKRVEQISLANGGVAAKVRPAPKGLAAADMVMEMVNLSIADASYRAAAAVIETEQAMGKMLVEILA